MSKPLTLSIVIPVYNEEDHLKRCLDAITAQTEKPDEIIVVDNNSTDRSLQIAREYPDIKIMNELGQGVVYARNTGFNAANSDIIGRIDGDSVLPNNWVKQVKVFYAHESHMDHALTGGGYFYNVRLPRFNGWVQSQLAYRLNRFIAGFYILWGSNMAIPRAIWEDVKNDTCLRNDIHEDMDLAIHAHNAGYHITYKAKLRTGAYLKRFWENRHEQSIHSSRWPRTLRVHGFKLWWLGSVGNFFLYVVGQPAVLIGEGVGRLMGRRLK